MTPTDTESIFRTGGTLRRVGKVSLAVVLGAVAGAVLVFAYLRHKQDPFSWYQLDTGKPSYASEALFDSDISLPGEAIGCDGNKIAGAEEGTSHRTVTEFSSVLGKTRLSQWLRCGSRNAGRAILYPVVPQNTPSLPRYTALRKHQPHRESEELSSRDRS
jgi:hypothetical protein